MPGPRVVAWLLVLLIAGGCASVRYTDTAPASEGIKASPSYIDADVHWRRAMALSNDLLAMDARISPGDAALVAETAIFYPLRLADDYELISPPLWHNTLVNMGVKPRGLCIDWTQDLLLELKSLGLRTVSFHWGVANHDATFRIEHSTAVVTARGQPFSSGMVLDPWRDSGRLFWSRVDADPEYVWSDLRTVQVERRAAETASASLEEPAKRH